MGDRLQWKIPLGNPIIDVDIAQIAKDEFRKKIHDCLEKWIILERKNILNHQLGVPISFEFIKWEPNEAPMGDLLRIKSEGNVRAYTYFNDTPNQNIDECLSALAPPAVALGFNLATQGKTRALKEVKSVLKSLVARGFVEHKWVEAIEKIGRPKVLKVFANISHDHGKVAQCC